MVRRARCSGAIRTAEQSASSRVTLDLTARDPAGDLEGCERRQLPAACDSPGTYRRRSWPSAPGCRRACGDAAHERGLWYARRR